MNQLTIKRISYRNFKGIKDFTLHLNGENQTVKADNAVGKTTLGDGYQWLFTGKNLENQADFGIKPLDSSNNPIHNLDSEVEAVCDHNGKEVVFKKVFHEVYTKKRGSINAEFTGHTIDYYVDGVPKQEKEYVAKLSEIAQPEVFMLLTNPKYFNDEKAFPWKKRRELLLKVCGDVSIDEVVASNPNLSRLPDILQGRDIEDHKKVIRAKQAKINDELKQVPNRIDEANRNKPELPKKTASQLQEEIDGLNRSLDDKKTEKNRIETGGEIAEKRKEYTETETAILDEKKKNQTAIEEKTSGLKDQLFKAQETVRDTTSGINSLCRKLTELKANLNSLTLSRQNLRDQYDTLDIKQFQFDQAEVCPTCGQAIPAERLQSAREAAETEFNRKKSEKLESIKAEGLKVKDDIEKIEKEIARIEQEIKELEGKKSTQSQEVTKIQSQIDQIKNEKPENSEAIKDLELKSLAIQREIEQLKNGNSQAISKVNGEISAINDSIRALQSEIAKFDLAEKVDLRIEELKEQQKTLAKDFERLEGELYLLEEFTKTKVSFLESRINSKFQYARFKMFNIQVNGGLDETCETIFNGVPYGSLNDGHKIIVSLDIMRTLSEYYGFVAPIFVDRAETVTEMYLPEMEAQIIRLFKPECDTAEDRQKYSQFVIETKELRRVS